MHLRFDIYGWTGDHPQKVMKELGVTYQHATPQSMFDQWWFWNCENIPNKLPSYLSELNAKAHDAIGSGLSKSLADEIDPQP